jgi:integrase
MGIYCKKTKDGQPRWYIEFRVGGKKVRECAGSSKKAVEQALAIRKAEILQGRYNIKKESKSPLFDDFTKEYLLYSKNNKKPGAYNRDVVSVMWLNKTFGGKRLSQITPLMVEHHKRRRISQVKGATVNRELSSLRRMFNLAIKWGKAGNNPVKEVKFFREDPFKERVLCQEEIDKLISECPVQIRPIVVTALHTGMRLREILELTWDSVDCINGFIVLTNTKNGKLRRIPMNGII